MSSLIRRISAVSAVSKSNRRMRRFSVPVVASSLSSATAPALASSATSHLKLKMLIHSTVSAATKSVKMNKSQR